MPLYKGKCLYINNIKAAAPSGAKPFLYKGKMNSQKPLYKGKEI
jgi:hypothetical protein